MTVRKILGGLAALALFGCASSGDSGGGVALSPLSSKPQFVSGGDALLQLRVPAGLSQSDIAITNNGRPAAVAMTQGAPGVYSVLISGLDLGANKVSARAGGRTARLTLTNHPITGPILSGPHMQPYECRTVQSGLGEPDGFCHTATRYDYFYRARDNSFKPWPLNAPRPADLVTTTTIDGETVPYIVKVESGTINRTIYRIAMLDDPGTTAKEDGWNGRFGVTFGGGSGAQYNQGTNQVTSVLNDLYLSRGFAFMNATELVNGLHSNAVLQGETLMMLKEHFIEEYGPPKWTVGTGGSGGAIQQLLLTQIYPGLLDGLQPSLSFPDSSMHTPDCGVIGEFWRSPRGAAWSAEKKAAVEGYFPNTCAAWERSFVPVSRSINKAGCSLNDQSLIYDAVTNPTGARCGVHDWRVNIYGRDPKTGFARKAVDNVGLQYGLKALNEGKITVDEFLDVNEGVGGYDQDGNFQAQRSVGDVVAIRNAYKSGVINSGGGGLANVPILHYRNYTDAAADIHDRHRDLTIRARLEKANGRSDNQVIWVGPGRAAAPAAGAAGRAGRGAAATNAQATAAAEQAAAASTTTSLAQQALDVMTQWLDAMAADPAPLSTDKVVRHKPSGAVDAYFTAGGQKVAERATFEGDTGYNRAYPNHWEPRLVAGAPMTNDVLKCQLKAIRMNEYRVSFTAEQQSRLRRIFPDGVCDWSRPSVGYVKFGGPYQNWG